MQKTAKQAQHIHTPEKDSYPTGPCHEYTIRYFIFLCDIVT